MILKSFNSVLFKPQFKSNRMNLMYQRTPPFVATLDLVADKKHKKNVSSRSIR